jgi:regulator of nucleoside diphosphate kinase
MSTREIICAYCGANTVTSLLSCRACGRPYAIPVKIRNGMPPAFDLSPCVLVADDHALLLNYLETHTSRDTFAANQLRAKLLLSNVRYAADIAPEVVTLNSRLAFWIYDGTTVTRTLVRWGRELDVGLTFPVTAPLGVAMLGRKAGETVRYMQRDGSYWTVTIEAVLFQPQAASRRAAHRERLARLDAAGEGIKILSLRSRLSDAGLGIAQ